MPKKIAQKKDKKKNKEEKWKIRRRKFTYACVFSFLGVNLLMTLRFFFPRILFEPKTSFTIGSPGDFGFGIDTRFQQKHRIWVVRNAERLFVIYARCTHLGCTPDWVQSENKFKCPCHGSGYDNEGVNFEGPAPRPMDRAKLSLNPQGKIIVDVSQLYQCSPGAPCNFDNPEAYLTI